MCHQSAVGAASATKRRLRGDAARRHCTTLHTMLETNRPAAPVLRTINQPATGCEVLRKSSPFAQMTAAGGMIKESAASRPDLSASVKSDLSHLSIWFVHFSFGPRGSMVSGKQCKVIYFSPSVPSGILLYSCGA